MKQTVAARHKVAAGRRKQAARTGFRAFDTELVIEDLGGLGEGIARYDAKTVFVPLTVPGDRVAVRINAERGGALVGTLLDILETGESRTIPPCPWFGICGGCALQHLKDSMYKTWKARLIIQALARKKIDASVSPLVCLPLGNRRRTTFSFVHGREGVVLGYHRRSGRETVPIDRCLLLDDAINTFIPALKDGVARCVARGVQGTVSVVLCDSGLDVILAAPLDLTLENREALALFAEKNDLARLSCAMPEKRMVEPLFCCRPATVAFGGVDVQLPLGGFLQPSREGEQALVEKVMNGLDDVRGTVFDLFCGCGTFSLPLARRGIVRSYEGDAAAVSALATAALLSGLPVRAETRDLACRPLLASELKGAAAVVFDPPRVGAGAQVEQIAAMGKDAPGRIVAVSCNPATFARDAAILTEGPYALDWVTPVDQFPYSAHLELVAAFHRRR